MTFFPQRSTDAEFCINMLCSVPGENFCYYQTPARGTPCGSDPDNNVIRLDLYWLAYS